MIHNRIITENRLDEWVRGNAEQAQGVIVELIYRLVAASSSKPKERRFPLGDSIGQPGPDGVLITDFGFDPFVPEGRSYWEIGTGTKAGDKATSDYTELTQNTPEAVRHESTFIFVTPLSGKRDWPFTWKEGAQASWLRKRRQSNEWQDVRVIDGSGLIDWLYFFPAVELWLASTIGLPVHQIQTPELLWNDLRTIGDPPPLIPHLFLANRDEACDKLKEVFSGTMLQLRLDTRFPDQMANFVAAYVAAMSEDAKFDAAGRCVVVSGTDGWGVITALREAHILVAAFNLDVGDQSGTILLEKARRAGHAVIYAGMPGGIPHPTRIPMPTPKAHHVKEVLQQAGYKEERARVLAQKSDGNLSSLLRCLQNLSLLPEWAQKTNAAELVIAELLGQWSEHSEADKAVAEKLSGNSYGEWIGKMREVTLLPDTPLIQRDGVWKVVARYEGWYALGPRLFDEHLDRVREAAISVLRERDPQFELPPDQRFAASIYGKTLTHSHTLRNGLAESLALLGSHPKALASCSIGKAEATAILSVREILSGADWVLWASLNHLLPLLAEAAPGEFLDSVESALDSAPCPFDTVFSQEGYVVTGSNYITGLLWALETLAWDHEYLTRVIIILGGLAARDPGGNWGNRPANSLSTILLPWLPQTCATPAKRKTAVATLLREYPDVAWKLLLDLFPSSQQVSLGSRKPAWRELIAEDCSRHATDQEYWEQIAAYTELAIAAAGDHISKLVDLIERLDDLPPPVRDQLFAYLGSEIVVSMSQAERTRLWTKLVDFVSKHRKFADAEWAMKPDIVNEIAAIADRLVPGSPHYRYQRLFNEQDFDLYEQNDNYEEQFKELEGRRLQAISEVFTAGGTSAILAFAKAIETPWRVGVFFGMIAPDDIDEEVLPTLLESENERLAQFAGGFVWGRFRTLDWRWADGIDMSKWSPSQQGQLLAYLPFSPETWQRSSQLLRQDESPYWSRANANPYEAKDGLEWAIDRLIENGRANEAIKCVEWLRNNQQRVESQQAIRALQAVLHSLEGTRAMNEHAIIEVVKMLQADPDANPDDLFKVEWAFLPLLNRHYDAFPKLLEQRLADDPAFFCEVICIVFRSRKEEHRVEEPSEQQKNIATNAYKLLNKWRTPPGSQEDGTYNGDALTDWLANVKTACEESGHLEVALTMVGHVLVHTPPDTDGLWLHHAAATVLNARDAKDMRDGFQTELFNSRGAHFWTAGQAERGFAEMYRARADEVEAHGYHRLASSLKQLAASYEHHAEREAARDLFED